MPDLLNQICAFLLTLLTGTLVGVIIHFYQLIVRKSRLRKYFLFVVDFTLWILLMALIFFGLVLINLGELRVYIFIALIVGVLLYHRYAARYLHYPLAAAARLLVACFSCCKNLLLIPFRTMGRIIKDYFKKAEEEDSLDIE